MNSFKITFLLFYLLLSIEIIAQKKIEVPGQDSAYILYSQVDTATIKQKYKNAFTFGQINLEAFEVLRNDLKPLVEKEDPLALLIYAKTYDLGPYGLDDKKSDSFALKYYQKLINMKHANTEMLFYQVYKWGILGLQPDYEKSLYFLKQAIIHGDNKIKANAHFELAHIYADPKNNFGIKSDTSVVIKNLEEAALYDPSHHMAIDWLSALYLDKGEDYIDRALQLMLLSPNMQSHLEAAEIFIEGKLVKKDMDKGLKIIYSAAKQIKEEYELRNVNNYMGSRNPVYMLNELYCKKIITKEQLGEYFIESYCYN